MQKYMQLLRDLWNYIDPLSSMADNKVSRSESQAYRNCEDKRIAEAVYAAKQKVKRLRRIGRLDKLTGGFKTFCRKHHVTFV